MLIKDVNRLFSSGNITAYRLFAEPSKILNSAFNHGVVEK